MILGHIRLCKRRIDKILALRIIMLQGDLRSERIAIRKMQDLHLSKLQIIYRILKGTCRVIPEDKPIPRGEYIIQFFLNF